MQCFMSPDQAQRFLAVSEAVAHLDYAVGEGKLNIEASSGVEYYRV